MNEKRMSGTDRKQLILSSVRGLLCDKGLSVTTKELSEAAGVSEALIYKYFSSKEEIYLSLVEKCCQGHKGLSHELAELPPSSEVLVCATFLMIHIMTSGMQTEEPEFTLTTEQINGLVMQSLRDDGEVARRLFAQGLGPWVDYFISSMEAAENNGDLIAGPIDKRNLIWMIHHGVRGNQMTLMPTPDAFMTSIKDLNSFKKDLLVFSLMAMGMKVNVIIKIIDSNFFKDFKSKTIQSQGVPT